MNTVMPLAPSLLCSNTLPGEHSLSPLTVEKDSGLLLPPFPLEVPMIRVSCCCDHGSKKHANEDKAEKFAESCKESTCMIEDQAARKIQRLFRRLCQQSYNAKESALRDRLKEIHQQTQADLERIAALKERRKIELLLEMGMESRGELAVEILHSEQVLQESRDTIDELTRHLKLYKKGNAFLQKRCKSLKRRNKQLRLERRKQAQLRKKASKRNQEYQVILSHYQHRVAEEESRLEAAESQLLSCKAGNRRIRHVMGRMVQMVEERISSEEEDADKWDLVDQLYHIQRDGTHQKRRSYNTPVVSWGRGSSSAGYSKRKSLPADVKRALSNCQNKATASQ